MNWLKSAFVLLCICGFCSCHPLFCVWNMGYKSINSHIQRRDVIGTYKLTADSKKMMYNEGKYTHMPNSTLVINADSTYLLTNAPDWLNNVFGYSSRGYFSRKGKWFLVCDTKDGCVMEIEDINTGDLLATKKGKLNILLTVGDGDACQGIIYEKDN